MSSETDCRIYREIYDIAVAVGSEHDPMSFAKKALMSIKTICAFDEGLVYLLDGNYKVVESYLYKIDEYWNNQYLEYYSDFLKHAEPKKTFINGRQKLPLLCVIDWEHSAKNEFTFDYIHARGLKCNCSLLLYDLDGTVRTNICMDRTSGLMFTKEELHKLTLLAELLNAMHNNFFFRKRSQIAQKQVTNAGTVLLTDRELQITTLLCQGVSPSNISKRLGIAVPTTYSHISNIYEKLNVSSKQELITRMIG